jgi:hypothetical protein
MQHDREQRVSFQRWLSAICSGRLPSRERLFSGFPIFRAIGKVCTTESVAELITAVRMYHVRLCSGSPVIPQQVGSAVDPEKLPGLCALFFTGKLEPQPIICLAFQR